MAIDQNTIEQIRNASDIISVVRRYLPDLKQAGRNWKACCPFHNEKTPSFMISPEKGIYKCFGCGAAGDVFSFVSKMDNLSWIEAVRKLAEQSGIEIKESKFDPVKVSEKTKLFEILETSAKFYHRNLLESKLAQGAREYLAHRGVTQQTIKKFMLGYAPKNALLQAALKKGYTTEELIKAGIITKTQKGNFFEYMSERVIFPIFDAQGRVVAFGGRTLGAQEPKYLNSPETAVYSKSSNLYGLFQTLPQLRKERKMIILEGYMDVVIPQQFGISGAVASLGTAFTHTHAKLVARYADKITLLFDADDAGRTATQRALEIFVEDGIECVVSSLPEGVDADEYLNEFGKDAFLEMLEKSSISAIDFMIARTSAKIAGNSAEAKAKKISELLNFVLKSPNAIVAREWVKKISQNIGVDEEAVWREYKKKKASAIKGYARGDNAEIHKEPLQRKNLSLEENLLLLVLKDKNLTQKIPDGCFKDAKCVKVYGHILNNLSEETSLEAEILNNLKDDEADWFSSIAMSAIEYKNTHEAFDIILKDLQAAGFEARRKELGKLLKDGNISSQELSEYNTLTKKLKGSGK